MSRELLVPALDGLRLRATLFEPEGAHCAVIVSAATSTPRGFYRAFAQYLCSLGAAVLTYDYRGCGDAPEALRRSVAVMRDWGTLDFPGAVAWMRERYPSLPLHAVGHSVGGHVLLMAPNNHEISRAVTVASQSGYWRLYRGFERYRVFGFMAFVMPLATRLFGFFPGRLLKFGEDLAPGVLMQWRRWCTSPGYFFDDPSMRETLANARHFHAPTLMIGLADDPWATRRAIDALQVGFTDCPVTRMELEPAELGIDAIGHMGFFRSRDGERLWPHVTSFLEFRHAADRARA